MGLFAAIKDVFHHGHDEIYPNGVSVRHAFGGTEYRIPGGLCEYGFVQTEDGRDGKKMEISLKTHSFPYRPGCTEYHRHQLGIVSDMARCRNGNYCSLETNHDVVIFVPDDARFFCSGSKSLMKHDKEDTRTYTSENHVAVDAKGFGKLMASLGTREFFTEFPGRTAIVLPLAYEKDIAFGKDSYGQRYVVLNGRDRDAVIVNYESFTREDGSLKICPSLLQADSRSARHLVSVVENWLDGQKESLLGHDKETPFLSPAVGDMPGKLSAKTVRKDRARLLRAERDTAGQSR